MTFPHILYKRSDWTHYGCIDLEGMPVQFREVRNWIDERDARKQGWLDASELSAGVAPCTADTAAGASVPQEVASDEPAAVSVKRKPGRQPGWRKAVA